MRRSIPALLALPFAASLAAARSAPPESAAGGIRLKDVAREAGVDFVHENSPTPRKHLIETMPGGVAVLDYDGDGRLDIFFTNGAAIPSLEKDAPRYSNRLFRNEGGMKFRDVTEAALLRGSGYAMAAAVGDYDNDGDADLFVGGVHRQALYRNTGGRFEEVAAKAGVTSDQWVVGAGWLDYDNDGWLDLFVVNYTVWTADYDRFCGDAARGIRVYCHPKWFAKVPLTLYRNRGDGTFEDVSAKSGIAAHKGRGMGIAFADYDDDGRLDAYVTNDKLPSFLFHNRKDGTFEETALLAGVSLPEHGQDVSAMGVDFRDYDNDGRPDIHVTALTGESFPLYRNLGGGLFQDVTHKSLLSRLVAGRSGWSNGLVDLDNDGWKDLFTANAHVSDEIERFEKTAYRLANSVFQSRGDGTFDDASAESGLEAGPARAHRGAAFGDFDQDGRVDVVVTALGAPAELWHNESTGVGHWLDVRLVGTKSNRDGIGAVVKLTSRGDTRWREQVNHQTTAVGYASSTAGPVHFGTGSATTIDTVEVRWPSGTRQVLKDVRADQVLTVREAP
jgi:enediyne biosynthesis protein E4